VTGVRTVEPRLELGCGVAGVTVPGVVIAGTTTLTGVPMVLGVDITSVNTAVGISLWVAGVAVPGVAIAAAGVLMGVLVTRDDNQ
jgi:hypothetical protein